MKVCYACKQIISDELLEKKKKDKVKNVQAALKARVSRGLPIGRNRLKVKADDVVKLCSLGLSHRQIAKKLNVSTYVVFSRLKEAKP